MPLLLSGVGLGLLFEPASDGSSAVMWVDEHGVPWVDDTGVAWTES